VWLLHAPRAAVPPLLPAWLLPVRPPPVIITAPPPPLPAPPPARFWNDPKVLAKLGEKLGDVVPPPGAAPPAGAAPPGARPVTAPAVPDIDNLWDAAKWVVRGAAGREGRGVAPQRLRAGRAAALCG
jgi:hypothetical protein